MNELDQKLQAAAKDIVDCLGFDGSATMMVLIAEQLTDKAIKLRKNPPGLDPAGWDQLFSFGNEKITIAIGSGRLARVLEHTVMQIEKAGNVDADYANSITVDHRKKNEG
jgi:hypothetical protein